jgi:hypothetical protein
MKKRDVQYMFAILALITAIIVLVYFKFIRKQESAVSFDNPEKITVSTIGNNLLSLSDIIDNSGELFLVVFNFDDCYSCISRGIFDLISLKKAGKKCAALVVHDNIDEIRGWSEKQDFSPFYVIKKNVYFEHIKSPHTPVLIHFKDGEIRKYHFISTGS